MPRAKSKFRKGKTPSKTSSPIRRDLDTLIQGVSQQPPHLRPPGAGAEQINGWSSPIEGLTKRNAARFQAKVLDAPATDFYLELLDIQQGEQYSVLCRPGETDQTILEIRRLNETPTVQVHGLGMSGDGNQIICTKDSYLYNEPGAFYKDYVLINSGPIGLLLNRNKTTAFKAVSGTGAEATQGQGLIFIRAVAYQITYTAYIDDAAIATFTTPSAGDDDNTISTSTVATSLASQINGVAGYTAVSDQYVVSVTKDDGTSFKLTIDDGRSGELANAFTDTVQTLANLPIIAPNDYIVEVESDPSTTIDNRWLKFATFSGEAIGEGAWQETVKPGIPFEIDPDTMPLIVYREAENVFFVGPADGTTHTQTVDGTDYEFTFPSWGPRSAGDENTSPNPEFIGRKIRDHVLFRSRYVVIADESIQFSETDDIFNFFNDTSLTVLNTDPFGLRGTSERSSPLEWMIAVEDSILAFSQTTQFQIRAADADVLTPLTGSIFRLSNLEMNSNVRPKLSGLQVLFATDYFGYTHFREFKFGNTRNNNQMGLNLGSSLDITNYLPKYIKGLITHWDIGEAIDVAVAVSPTDKRDLYVYKYYWTTTDGGGQKVQQSWSKWSFAQEIQWVRFQDNQLYMLMTDDEGTYFNIQLNDELELPTEPQIHLDRLLQYPPIEGGAESAVVTASYDATTKLTTFNLPYAPTEKALAIVRFINDDYQGLKLGETTTKTLVCKERGDWTSYAVAFGEPYEFKYEFNKAFIPDTNEAGTKRVGQLSGRTQVLRWTINHVDTGEYNVRIKRSNRSPDSVHHYRARTLNVFNNTLDESNVALASGAFEVPVCSKNDQCSVIVESDSWLPLTVTSASWRGVYSDPDKQVG